MHQLAFLEATDHASLRTKNRIAQHGPIFSILERGNPSCLNGRAGMLLEANTWSGWIPVSEVLGTMIDDGEE